MANVSTEAKELNKLAAQKNLILLEGIHWLYVRFSLLWLFSFRSIPCSFHPSAQRVKQLVGSGEFGKITSIRSDFALPSLLSQFVFLKDDIRYNYGLGGGVTMDMGSKNLESPLF